MKRARARLDLNQLERGQGALLTSADVAALLRVHPQHVYRLLRSGLPARRVGGEWRFNADAVLAWAGGRPRKRATAVDDLTAASRPPLLAANGDLAIELLLAQLASTPGALLGLVPADRTSGLELLRSGRVLTAGYHGSDIPTDVDGQRLAFIHLVDRRVGLAMHARITLRSLRQIRSLRLASRPETAGIRQHFDDALRKGGADPRTIHAHAALLPSHSAVACAVARGDADLGVTTAAWAARVGLKFRAICDESYGLLVPAALLGDPRITRLCETAQGAHFRHDIAGVAGYEARHAGTIRYQPPEIPSARRNS
ncbi:MAG TPA: helix-turn-helix transcriptional regulator [Polyangiaceae bacterium]|jgi:excisionase family DNA binding protein